MSPHKNAVAIDAKNVNEQKIRILNGNDAGF